MSAHLPKPDENLAPNTVAIGRDGTRVSITITCADLVAALTLYRSLCEQANNEGFVTIDFPVKPRPTIDAG